MQIFENSPASGGSAPPPTPKFNTAYTTVIRQYIYSVSSILSFSLASPLLVLQQALLSTIEDRLDRVVHETTKTSSEVDLDKYCHQDDLIRRFLEDAYVVIYVALDDANARPLPPLCSRSTLAEIAMPPPFAHEHIHAFCISPSRFLSLLSLYLLSFDISTNKPPTTPSPLFIRSPKISCSMLYFISSLFIRTMRTPI